MRGSGVQGFRVSGVQGFRGSGVQGFRGSGVQGFRGSGVQGFRGSGVQGFRGSGKSLHTLPQVQAPPLLSPRHLSDLLQNKLGAACQPANAQ